MRSTWLTMIFGAVFFTLVLVHLHAAGSRGEGAGTQGGGEQTTGEWSMYRGDLAATGASPLNQITTGNVGDLAEVWTYSLAAVSEEARGPNSQGTPIVVDGVMYVPAADRVVALDPDTGREIWRHGVTEGRPSRRGV